MIIKKLFLFFVLLNLFACSQISFIYDDSKIEIDSEEIIKLKEQIKPIKLIYHYSNSKKKSEEYKTFIIMERKLLNYIMNPSLILTWIFGLSLVIVICG